MGVRVAERKIERVKDTGRHRGRGMVSERGRNNP